MWFVHRKKKITNLFLEDNFEKICEEKLNSYVVLEINITLFNKSKTSKLPIITV